MTSLMWFSLPRKWEGKSTVAKFKSNQKTGGENETKTKFFVFKLGSSFGREIQLFLFFSVFVHTGQHTFLPPLHHWLQHNDIIKHHWSSLITSYLSTFTLWIHSLITGQDYWAAYFTLANSLANWIQLSKCLFVLNKGVFLFCFVF